MLVAPQDLTFGRYRLDRRARRLTRDGEAVAIHGRALELLGALAAAGGALVAKDALLRAAWAGVTVEENNLHQQISTLRKVLGEGAIITVPGRGYRLAVASPSVGLAADGGEAQGKPTVAVLPFACLATVSGLQYFAAGIAGEITTALARVGSVVVVVPRSDFMVDCVGADARPMAHRLGVRYLLEGSVKGGGGQVRILSRLIEAATGVQLWAERFDGATEDSLALQDRVTARVVAAIAPRLVIAEIERVQRLPAGSSRPYDLLLRGLALYSTRTRSSMEQAICLLRQAIALDPAYALAHAHLANTLFWMVAQGWAHTDHDALADMLAIAQTALTIGGDDPEVLLLVSTLVCTRGSDLDGGIAMVERSLHQNPNSAAAWRMLGVFQAYAGDTSAAIACIERADCLNPLDQGPARDHGYILGHFFDGDHEAVVVSSGKLLLGQPRFIPALRYRAASLGLLGRVDEGKQVVQRLLGMAPKFSVTWARRHAEGDQNNLVKSPGAMQAFYEGLRRAGAPEG